MIASVGTTGAGQAPEQTGVLKHLKRVKVPRGCVDVGGQAGTQAQCLCLRTFNNAKNLGVYPKED